MKYARISICSLVGSNAVGGTGAGSILSMFTFLGRAGFFALVAVDFLAAFGLTVFADTAGSALLFFATTKIPP